MPEFRYSARNTQGQLVDGVVTAADRSAAIAQVEQKRCVPIRVQPVEPGAKTPPANAPAALQQKSPASGGKETSSSKALTAKPDARAAKPAPRTGAAAAPAPAGMKLNHKHI